MQTYPLFLTSGDPIADRRYGFAAELRVRGDLPAAADLLAQALEIAPRFAAAWFALGEVREALGDCAGAVAAFREAQACDPDDRQGAALHLARLSAGAAAMSPAYVRTLFDQYAPRFDEALTEGLAYRGPALLRDAVAAACRREGRAARFSAMLDLGCGTGLAGAAFRTMAMRLTGVDLSPGMIAQARAKSLYDRLETGDLLEFLAGEAPNSYDLVVAADVLAYLGDLALVARAAARVLAPRGLFAFTVETHAGDGVILGEKLRYAHGKAHMLAALATAGLHVAELTAASTRSEGGIPVPGLVVVATTA
jgi:predicted TPR repeat methyltransferase